MKQKIIALLLATLSLQACTYLGLGRGQATPAPKSKPAPAASTATAPTPTRPAPPATERGSKRWDYIGNTGPDHWGELDLSFATCKLGREQSPIDIRYAEMAPLRPLGFHYHASPAEVLNTGHSIQVNLAAGGWIRIGKKDWKLIQFNFHTPSEEKINGNSYPLSAHLVHRNDEGKVAIVAVMYMVGAENQGLKPVFDALPVMEGTKKVLNERINPADILPGAYGYYAYVGSLTTPPCTEDVNWQILKQPAEISEAQLAAFQRLYPMNARPVQPLNNRTIYEGF